MRRASQAHTRRIRVLRLPPPDSLVLACDWPRASTRPSSATTRAWYAPLTSTCLSSCPMRWRTVCACRAMLRAQTMTSRVLHAGATGSTTCLTVPPAWHVLSPVALRSRRPLPPAASARPGTLLERTRTTLATRRAARARASSARWTSAAPL